MTATTMTPVFPDALTELPCQKCGWEPEAGKLWPSFGKVACLWIEENCICAEGDFYGQLIKLRPDQKRFVYCWYEYCGGCGYWRYSESIRTEATGGGKTTFIAAIVVLEFAGPPMLAPASPNIIIAAASFTQADLLFSIVAIMCGGRDNIAGESPLCGKFDVYDTEISFKGGRPGTIRRVAAVAGTNEGGQPTNFVCDEVHEWGDVGSNKARVHTVIGKSLKKRNVLYKIPQKNGRKKRVYRGPGRNMNLSTAGFDIDHSMFGKMITRARQARKDPNVAPKLLYDVFEAPDGLDYENPADRRIAVIAASMAAGVLWNIEDRVNDYGSPTMGKNEWLRYNANQWVDLASESWLKDHPGAWSECCGQWLPTNLDPTVLAVDMALNRDSVAVEEVSKTTDGRTAVLSKIWYPADGKLPFTEIFDYIRTRAKALSQQFQGLVYDPRYFELSAQELEDEGLLVIQFDQSPQRMAPAVGLTYDKILAKTLVHNGDPDLTKQVKAAVKREQERGGFTLSKGRSKHHIDGAVAMCMGVWALETLDEAVSVLDQIW